MSTTRKLFPWIFGFGLAIATAALVGGCSTSDADAPPSAADKEEQSYLQERIQKGFNKKPGKNSR
jgi:hypothetical protein